MFLCQWSLDIVFGKQSEALAIIKAWGEEKMRSSRFSLSEKNRVYAGYAGESAAHIVDEYVFKNLEDFQNALSDMGKQEFKKFAEQIAPLIVPASQKWNIYRIVSSS